MWNLVEIIKSWKDKIAGISAWWVKTKDYGLFCKWLVFKQSSKVMHQSLLSYKNDMVFRTFMTPHNVIEPFKGDNRHLPQILLWHCWRVFYSFHHNFKWHNGLGHLHGIPSKWVWYMYSAPNDKIVYINHLDDAV